MQSLLLNLFLRFQMIFCESKWFADLFKGPLESLLEDIMNISDFDAAKDGLKFISNSGSASDTYSAMWTSVQDLVNNVITPIGIALTVTFFIMSLVDMASKDNTTLEHYVREFIKLIIGVTIVNNSWVVILYLLKISELIMNEVDTGSIKSIKDANKHIKAILKDSSGGTILASLLAGLIPWLVKKIAIVAMYVCVFMRALDVAWRAIVLPIGAANIYEGGINSPGIKYIKSFFGSLLAGVVVMAIIGISPSLYSAAYEMGLGGAGGNNYIRAMLALAGAELALIGAVFGASSKAKEMFT